MLKIGVDFDNTIVCYDELFYKIALEENLIPQNFPHSKLLIRDYLRRKNKDQFFTLLQAEVYGKRILESSPAPGVIFTLKELVRKGFEVSIISHKSINPYKGPKYNLHKAAISWLEKNKIFEKDTVGLSKDNIFFNLTKEDKINKIHDIGCDYFIDDLPEILNMVNEKTKKILYTQGNEAKNKNFIILKNWRELIKILNIKK